MGNLISWKWKRNTTNNSTRIIRVNDVIHQNKTEIFPNNSISTTRYNLITFLPKNLLQQFYRLSNIFFLFLIILSYIPQISSLQPHPLLITVIIVLAITAIKDAIDDFTRYRSDRQINNRQTEVLSNEKYVMTYWKDIQVGNIVKIKNNDLIPADMILISTSDTNGMCLIETAELDGETNLKRRGALIETIDLKDDIGNLSNFHAEIECEQPNNNLRQFDGKLTWNQQSYSLKNDNVLLRGTRLRNTQWTIGVVFNTGHDTKLMRNTGKSIYKRTKIDHWLNKILIGTFILLFFICLLMSIACGFWEYHIGSKFRMYLPPEPFVSSDLRLGSVQISALIFWSYIILFCTVVPISLSITMELTRLFQTKWIDWDCKMYSQSNNIQAQSHTTSLTEQLGQIQYIFSDKTGTLTQNIMTFKKCSIREQFYGDIQNENCFSENDDNFVWYDRKLIDAIEKNDNEYLEHFFTLLVTCHTVNVEEMNGTLNYQSQSPDENALISAARSFQFQFQKRTQNSITVRCRNQIHHFQLLNILDFNNYRRRMSIIIRRNDKIILYCKGSDHVIKQRLDPSEHDIIKITDQYLHNAACEGLRTLCLAWKEISENEYQQWSNQLKQVTLSIQNREKEMDKLYDEIEMNMKLIGMTAIEDKLQDGVPQTIYNLTRAGIKIWMLTGDKTETAENIGISCKLITDKMILKRIEGETEIDVNNQLDTFRIELLNKIEEIFHIKIDNQIKRISWNQLKIDQENRRDFDGFCLLITGSALFHALSDQLKMKFLELATMCKTVICCRVTPLQKSQVVELIMNDKNSITLAIGDGANDVSMIQKAHIGVGIDGQEGRQAVSASDYSIGQFRHLERLLLVHGRWSYLRISKFLNYSFYKNFAFTFCQLWYVLYCGFSAQTVFDPFFVPFVNILFTTVPVVTMGAFDQDISDDDSLNEPHLYLAGQQDRFFNKKTFIECAIRGLITSCLIFFFCYLCLSSATHPSGIPLNDLQSFGFAISIIFILVINLENALDMWYWTKTYVMFVIGTIVVFFIFHLIQYLTSVRMSYYGTIQTTLTNLTFWLTLILISVIILLPNFTREFFRIRFMPNDTDRARLKQKFDININERYAIPLEQQMATSDESYEF